MLRSAFLFAPNRIYVEIVHYVKIVLWPSRNLFPFWRQLISHLGVKITGYSFLGIPLCFRWCLRINSFGSQIRSSLEFPAGTSELVPFGASSDRLWVLWFREMPSCWFLFFFPRWGLLFLFICGELHFPPLWVYYSYPFLGNFIYYRGGLGKIWIRKFIYIIFHILYHSYFPVLPCHFLNKNILLACK